MDWSALSFYQVQKYNGIDYGIIIECELYTESCTSISSSPGGTFLYFLPA